MFRWSLKERDNRWYTPVASFSCNLMRERGGKIGETISKRAIESAFQVRKEGGNVFLSVLIGDLDLEEKIVTISTILISSK